MEREKKRHIINCLITVFAVVFTLVKATLYSHAAPVLSAAQTAQFLRGPQDHFQCVRIQKYGAIEKSWEEKFPPPRVVKPVEFTQIVLLFLSAGTLQFLPELNIQKTYPLSGQTFARLCILRI